MSRGIAFKIAALVVSIPLSIWLNGEAIQALWGWFVEPLGVRALSFGHALGIGLLAYFLTTNVPMNVEKEDRFVRIVAFSIAKPLCALFFGWLYVGLFGV